MELQYIIIVALIVVSALQSYRLDKLTKRIESLEI